MQLLTLNSLFMSSESNSNSKFHSTDSVANDTNSYENNNSYRNSCKASKKLINFEIDPVNKTLTEVLKEVHQVEKKYFDRYDKLRGHLPLAGFHFSNKYLEIQNIKNYLIELAFWLYNGKIYKMPSSLKELVLYGNPSVSSLNGEQTTVEPYVKDMANWIFEFSALSDEELLEIFNRSVALRYWGPRSRYTNCLKNEILDRAFNSEILFERNSSGTVTAFNLSKKVRLVDGVLVIDH